MIKGISRDNFRNGDNFWSSQMTSVFQSINRPVLNNIDRLKLGRVKRIWYLSHMRAAKVQASLRIRTVSPEPPLLAHTSSESRGTFRQKTKSLAPLNGWACAVEICHDGRHEFAWRGPISIDRAINIDRAISIDRRTSSLWPFRLKKLFLMLKLKGIQRKRSPFCWQ